MQHQDCVRIVKLAAAASARVYPFFFCIVCLHAERSACCTTLKSCYFAESSRAYTHTHTLSAHHTGACKLSSIDTGWAPAVRWYRHLVLFEIHIIMRVWLAHAHAHKPTESTLAGKQAGWHDDDDDDEEDYDEIRERARLASCAKIVRTCVRNLHACTRASFTNKSINKRRTH